MLSGDTPDFLPQVCRVAVALGSDCYEGVKAACHNTLQNLEVWKDVTASTNFTKGS